LEVTNFQYPASGKEFLFTLLQGITMSTNIDVGTIDKTEHYNLPVSDVPLNPISRKERWAPYLILGPALLVTGVVLIPFFISIYYSLTDYRFTRPDINFVGLQNYIRILSSKAFWHSVQVTLQYALIAVSIETLLGVIIAFLLNTESLMAKILRPFLLMPLMIAPLITTLMWRLMMSPDFGVLNYILSFFGQREFPWATSPKTAMFTVLLVEVWTFTPFIALLVLAGLKALPKEPFEAAQVDGASRWFTLKNITLPLLTPYITIAVIFRLIDSLRQFDIIFGMSKGGPGDTLMNFQVYGYTSTFTYGKPAEGLAYIVINWFIIYIISTYMVKYWRKVQSRIS
jgi:multiple sugar transport system permease protein